jgi:hypothetical protein
MTFTTRTDHRMTKIENRRAKPAPKPKRWPTKPKDHDKIYKIKQSRSDKVSLQ